MGYRVFSHRNTKESNEFLMKRMLLLPLAALGPFSFPPKRWPRWRNSGKKASPGF